MTIQSAFELVLPHGLCTGLALPEGAPASEVEAELHDEERAVAATMAPRRRHTWVLGRVALRRSLLALGVRLEGPIASTPRGAPALPPFVRGSVSHKEGLAVGLATLASEPGAAIGVDVEWERAPRTDVRRHVLREDEGVDLEAPWPEASRATMVRFSAKEAIYKALDPFVERYVGFHEVAVVPRDDGGASTVFHLRDPLEGPFDADVHWRIREGVVLTSARVVRLARP